MNPLYLLLIEIIYRPIFNILILFLALFSGNLGIAIIFLTLTVRFLLIKTSKAGNDMQKSMGGLQPKMQEIQEKYKDDPSKMQSEMMKLLKNEGIGPLKGCLSMLVQIPVFLGLYYVVQSFAQNTIDPTMVYSFLSSFGLHFTNINNITVHFMGINLLEGGNIRLTIVTCILVYMQMQMTMINKPATPVTLPGGQTAPDMTKMMKFMNIFLILMMGSFVYGTPAGVGLYITTTTLFSVIQFGMQNKNYFLAQKAVLQAKRKKVK